MRTVHIATTVVAALMLTSCAPAYDEATRDDLRSRVVAVSEASAGGDWQGAIDGLDALSKQVEEARDDGRLDDGRFESITHAMELVRQDLEVAIMAAAAEAERQRLEAEQAALQDQLTQLQAQQDAPAEGGDGAGKGKDDGPGGKEKKGKDDGPGGKDQKRDDGGKKGKG